MSPALADGIFTTEPPGKSSSVAFSTFPVLCNDHFYLVPDHVHLLQGIPPTLPTAPGPGNPESMSCLLWVCLFWLFQINGSIRYVSFRFRLISPSVTFLRFIHVITHTSTGFLDMAKSYSIAWLHHNLCAHPSVDRHVGYFHLSAIVDDAAMNMCRQSESLFPSLLGTCFPAPCFPLYPPPTLHLTPQTLYLTP